MSWKGLAQTSLSDALVKHHGALEELDGIPPVDWLETDRTADAGHPCQKAWARRHGRRF
jgi:hypothetical protein